MDLVQLGVNFFVALFALIDPVGNIPLFAAATQDADLGARCARLVSDCDQVSYSVRVISTGITGSAELVDEGRRLFQEIGRKAACQTGRREVRTGVEKARERQP